MNGITGKVPDQPDTFLAFRVWRLSRPALTLRSLNAPRKATWLATALADPAGGWSPGGLLTALCPKSKGDEDHGEVPGEQCTCGIYAAKDLAVINDYLSPAAPVLGVVELGGRVIPAQQGYRAQAARVAAILLIDQALTLPHALLREVAGAYAIPALVPHSVTPEDYRGRLAAEPGSVADEASRFLRDLDGGGA